MTGRLRSLRASSNSREVYRRTYTWRADQVERIDTCYLGGGTGGSEYLSEIYAPDAGSGVGYDGLGRLKGGVGNAPWSQRKFAFDARGNMTSMVVDDGGVWSGNFDTSSNNRKDWMTSWAVDSWNAVNLSYDKDGRVIAMAGHADSSTATPHMLFDYVSGSSGVIFPGSDTVMRGVTVNSGSAQFNYNYVYDMNKRRMAKLGPVSTDIYIYDLGHQLLETVDPDLGVLDEYIWLAGAPIAATRRELGQYDGVGNCNGVACGLRFLVTDHIGKPVISLDANGRVTGVGEYEPFGAMNRVSMGQQSEHPYELNATAATIIPAKQRALTGLRTDFRAHFSMLDTEEDCSTGDALEGVNIWSLDAGTYHETLGGYARGDVWSHWWEGAIIGSEVGLNFVWEPNDGNTYPQAYDTTCEKGPQGAGQGWEYSGFVLHEYEYQRHESEAASYFPPLRFPGQYWDAETDLYENWHRYYWPLGNRYLSPEPYLQKTWWLSASAQQGTSTPTYAYGGNNPVRNTDPTGLFQLAPGSTCGNWAFAVALAKEWAGCKGLKANTPLNSCQTRIQSPSGAGCDICEFLAISGGPTMYVRPLGAFGAGLDGHTNVDSFYPAAVGHTEPNSSAVNSSLCVGDGNVEQLAQTLIDEATHWCAAKTGNRVPDCYFSSDTNCAGTGAAKYCRSMCGK